MSLIICLWVLWFLVPAGALVACASGSCRCAHCRPCFITGTWVFRILFYLSISRAAMNFAQTSDVYAHCWPGSAILRIRDKGLVTLLPFNVILKRWLRIRAPRIPPMNSTSCALLVKKKKKNSGIELSLILPVVFHLSITYLFFTFNVCAVQ